MRIRKLEDLDSDSETGKTDSGNEQRRFARPGFGKLADSGNWRIR